MHKNILFYAALALVASAPVHAASSINPPDALRLLLNQGSHVIQQEPNCPAYVSDTPHVKPARTLADDVANVLSDMQTGPISIEKNCELITQNKWACKVLFTLNAGELNWSRVYQFKTTVEPAKLKDLNCFQLP